MERKTEMNLDYINGANVDMVLHNINHALQYPYSKNSRPSDLIELYELKKHIQDKYDYYKNKSFIP